jgi:hypothetical protein
MTRLGGLEKKQAPWHLRWFYGVMHRMFGKDLTPAKLQMRLPGMVWGSIVWKPALAGRDTSRCVTFSWGKCGPRHAFDCPF